MVLCLAGGSSQVWYGGGLLAGCKSLGMLARELCCGRSGPKGNVGASPGGGGRKLSPSRTWRPALVARCRSTLPFSMLVACCRGSTLCGPRRWATLLSRWKPSSIWHARAWSPSYALDTATSPSQMRRAPHSAAGGGHGRGLDRFSGDFQSLQDALAESRSAIASTSSVGMRVGEEDLEPWFFDFLHRPISSSRSTVFPRRRCRPLR